MEALMELLKGLVRVVEKMGALTAIYISNLERRGEVERRLSELAGELGRIRGDMLSKVELEERLKPHPSDLDRKISALTEEVERLRSTMVSREEFEGLFKALASAIERARR